MSHSRLGTLLRSNTVKARKSWETSHCLNSHCGSMCYAAEHTQSYHPWGRCYPPEFAMGCPIGVDDLLCTPGGGGTTPSPLRRGKKGEFWSGICGSHPLSSHLTAASPGQHAQHAPPGWIPKVTATGTPEEQATSAILIEEVHLAIQVPTKYLSF